MTTQITMDFHPVCVVKNYWSDVWHLKRGHYAWPENADKGTFASVEEAVAYARAHGAEPELRKSCYNIPSR